MQPMARSDTPIAPPAAAIAVGAAAYAALVGGLGVTFNATPLIVGVVALVAAGLGRTDRLLPIAATLIGWGAAVLLVRDGPLPDAREAPAFLVGIALGLLAGHHLLRRMGSSASLVGGAWASLSGGLAFYLAYDVDALADWPVWTAFLGAWAVTEAFRARRVARPG